MGKNQNNLPDCETVPYVKIGYKYILHKIYRNGNRSCGGKIVKEVMFSYGNTEINIGQAQSLFKGWSHVKSGIISIIAVISIKYFHKMQVLVLLCRWQQKSFIVYLRN